MKRAWKWLVVLRKTSGSKVFGNCTCLINCEYSYGELVMIFYLVLRLWKRRILLKKEDVFYVGKKVGLSCMLYGVVEG